MPGPARLIVGPLARTSVAPRHNRVLYGGRVTAYPGFGVLLARLLARRGMSTTNLSSSAAVAESEVSAILDGGRASEALLRALAPALGFHAADLFVIANEPVPEDLAPLDREAGAVIDRLFYRMLDLPVDQRLRIHRLVEQLPQAARPPIDETKPPRVFDLEGAGNGAMLMSLLCGNRNLRFPTGAARLMVTLTHGDMYLAAATFGGIGYGRVTVRPEWVGHIAAVLGIPVDDLAAITGIEVADGAVRHHPLMAEMAGLLWKLRRLSASQMKHVFDQAESMLAAVPEDGPH